LPICKISAQLIALTFPFSCRLGRRAPKLRSALAHALRARNMPQLEFRHDSLTAQQQEVEDIFRMLEEQEEGSLGALDSGDEDVDDGSSKK
jgi:hypothetical protein